MPGRPPKQRLDYAGWDVNIFDSDPKIDKLIDAQGCAGFVIYFWLCQKAYGSNGYFCEWSCDDSATTARKIGGGVGSQTVINTVRLCLRVGLFDNDLFVGHQILTSRRIQKNWLNVAKERAGNTEIIKEYWLLGKDLKKARKDSSFVFHTLKSNIDMSEVNLDMSEVNSLYSPLYNNIDINTNYIDINKESRAESDENMPKLSSATAKSNIDMSEVNLDMSKSNNSTTRAKKPRKKKPFVPPALDEVKDYCKSRNSSVDPDKFFEFFDVSGWVDSKGVKVSNWKQKVITWENYANSSNSRNSQNNDNSDNFYKYLEEAMHESTSPD